MIIIGTKCAVVKEHGVESKPMPLNKKYDFSAFMEKTMDQKPLSPVPTTIFGKNIDGKNDLIHVKEPMKLDTLAEMEDDENFPESNNEYLMDFTENSTIDQDILQEVNVENNLKSPMDFSSYGHQDRAKKTRTFFKFLSSNRLYVVLACLFFVGMIYGVFMVKSYDETSIKSLSFITQGFISGRINAAPLQTFITSLSSTGILIIALYVLGYGAITIPISAGIMIFRGLGLGLSMGYMYAQYGLSGFSFSNLIILPAALISFFALLLACGESMKMSYYFLSKLLPQKFDQIKPKPFLHYTLKYLVYVLVLVMSAGLDCLMTFLFAGNFTMV